MRKTSYRVPTKVLVAQAESTLRQLSLASTLAKTKAFAVVGLDLVAFAPRFREATKALAETESAQERAKGASLRAKKRAKAKAEEGHRFVRALQARVRAFQILHADQVDLRERFRFGTLHSVRLQGEIHLLRTVLPEAWALIDTLGEVGVDAAFIESGEALITVLEEAREEIARANATVVATTVQLRALELRVSRLLDQLRTADNAVSSGGEQDSAAFSFDIFAAERGRRAARRKSRAGGPKKAAGGARGPGAESPA